MNWVRSRCFIVIFLVNHCFVFGKGLLLPKCVKILSINVPLDDPTKAERNYGLHADKKKAVLSHHPGIFKIHKGLSVEKGTVSLESLYHPGYFLRHKNYKFHLEKKVDKPIFNKDATFFILKVTNNPALYAFELCSHPSWFMGHKNYKPYRLVLGKVNESSKEVIDSTFYLASHHCLKKKEKDTTAEKKTILVGSGTFIDEPDEDSTIVINQASKKLSETSKDPEADGEKSDKEASNSNHTEKADDDAKSDKEVSNFNFSESVSQPGKNLNPEKAGSKDTNEDVINEVEEGSGNKTVDIKSQASADDVDRIANELVRHGVPNDSNDSSTNPWMNTLRHHNKTLRETLKELKPYDNNILYLRTCEDRFPKACEEWAAKRYCLTFGELMKRYCRRACKLCNNVLATEFTPCDKSCGGGIKLRMIKVNNRQVLQRRSCNMHNCPVNGGYTAFSNWSECSVTCGEGVRYRHRSCTNPKPQFGGHDCSRFGRPVDTMPCVKSCKELSKSKNHPAIHFDPDDYPEYVAEEKNPKIFERGDGHYFQWTPKHRRKKPVVLHHVNKNVYRHKDHNGKNHYLQVDEEKNPYDEYQTHVVRYQGQQVAKLQCGPSKLLHYRKHVPNIPDPEDFKRSNPYKMFEDSAGEVVYDKDGVPTGTTKDIVQSYDSPYKIILQRGKNNRMKVSEQCIESDASVDPDSYWKNGAQNYEGATSLGSEQPMSDPSSRMPTVGIIPKQITDDVGTTSLGSVQPSLPETSRMTTDLTTPNRFNDNGLYEYKYQDIGEGVDDKTFDADVSDQLSRAMKKETAGITQRFLIANQDPRPTLQEELLAEKEEAWRGGKI
ncbi:uncharacterized protein [Montipora capricornis]|uniref:uncharacterized protein isoform X9 n=1 Tax=Montipora capricornis TaxID=246305 RepID=UPI0035F219DF